MKKNKALNPYQVFLDFIRESSLGERGIIMININFDIYQDTNEASLTRSMFYKFDPPSNFFTRLEARIKDIQTNYKIAIRYDTVEATVDDDYGKKVVLHDQQDVYCAILQHVMNHPESMVMDVHLKDLFGGDNYDNTTTTDADGEDLDHTDVKEEEEERGDSVQSD